MKASRNKPRTRKGLPLKVWLPILIIVVIGGGIAWFLIAAPFSEKQRHIRQLDTKAKQLYADHQTCVEQLNKDYKELDERNQDAYQKSYDHCESIRKEQNEAVDQYNKLTQE